MPLTAGLLDSLRARSRQHPGAGAPAATIITCERPSGNSRVSRRERFRFFGLLDCRPPSVQIVMLMLRHNTEPEASWLEIERDRTRRMRRLKNGPAMVDTIAVARVRASPPECDIFIVCDCALQFHAGIAHNTVPRRHPSTTSATCTHRRRVAARRRVARTLWAFTRLYATAARAVAL